jgi:putative hydrolase of the HAD superfamily
VIRFEVFDLGQVLSSPPDIYHAPAELLGVDPEAYRELYWSHRRAYDTGGSRVEYWQPILDRLGVQPSGELIASLATLDADLWTELRPTAGELLEVVRGWNVQTALLSNAPLVLGKAIRRTAWVAAFDHVFISAELGVTKPDPAIYEVVTGELSANQGEIAFIDDRQANVDAAAAAGWNAHLWVDDADSLAWLRAVTGH